MDLRSWAAELLTTMVIISESCADGSHECPGIATVSFWLGGNVAHEGPSPCDCLCHLLGARAKLLELRLRVD